MIDQILLKTFEIRQPRTLSHKINLKKNRVPFENFEEIEGERSYLYFSFNSKSFLKKFQKLFIKIFVKTEHRALMCRIVESWHFLYAHRSQKSGLPGSKWSAPAGMEFVFIILYLLKSISVQQSSLKNFKSAVFTYTLLKF